MSKSVHVKLGERSYEIQVGVGLSVGAALDGQRNKRVLLVTDSNVGPLHGDRIEAELRLRGLLPQRVTVPAGEESKSLTRWGEILGRAVDAGLERGSAIVALGGGMVGDLAGFAAATLFRGVKLVQIPTSLLAMVDSSVGGKTGINLPQGKNLVGCFYQPVEVTADLAMLRTLPEREYLSGLGEVVKYGIIWDAAFLRTLEEQVVRLLERDEVCLAAVVARCCEIKAEVVAVDERESGVRAILNFGHTLAHAVEQVAGYGAWLHGEAVAIGMAYAVELSVREKGFAAGEKTRIVNLLEQLRLPVAPCLKGVCPEWTELRKVMATDKKTTGGLPRFVLAESVGSVAFGCEVSEEALRNVYEDLVAGG